MLHEIYSDRFVVLACDGVWDVMTNEEVSHFVWRKLQEAKGGDALYLPAPCMYNDLLISSSESSQRPISMLDAADVCDQLLEEVIRLGSQDNLSVVLIVLNTNITLSASSNKVQYDGDVSALDMIVPGMASSPLLSGDSDRLPAIAAVTGRESPDESVNRQLSFLES